MEVPTKFLSLTRDRENLVKISSTTPALKGMVYGVNIR